MRQSLIFFVLKETDKNILMISTFLGLNFQKGQKEERRTVNGEVIQFKYTEVVADHYIYRA